MDSNGWALPIAYFWLQLPWREADRLLAIRPNAIVLLSILHSLQLRRWVLTEPQPTVSCVAGKLYACPLNPPSPKSITSDTLAKMVRDLIAKDKELESKDCALEQLLQEKEQEIGEVKKDLQEKEQEIGEVKKEVKRLESKRCRLWYPHPGPMGRNVRGSRTLAPWKIDLIIAHHLIVYVILLFSCTRLYSCSVWTSNSSLCMSSCSFYVCVCIVIDVRTYNSSLCVILLFSCMCLSISSFSLRSIICKSASESSICALYA